MNNIPERLAANLMEGPAMTSVLEGPAAIPQGRAGS
jgi:hypothetical protein